LIRLAAILVLALVSLGFVVPAYSLTPSRGQVLSGIAESGPLTSLPAQMPSAAGSPDSVKILGHIIPKNAIRSDFGSIKLNGLQFNSDNIQRTLVLGRGDSRVLGGANVVGMGGSSMQGPFLGVAFSKNPLALAGSGYMPDMPLAFDALHPDNGDGSSNTVINTTSITTITNNSETARIGVLTPNRLSGASVIGADRVASIYNVTGDNVKVGIVDTGSDFSNPDMRNALARDAKGIPMMLDADGQGLVLTNAKYLANIDQKTGAIMNFTTSTKNGKVQLPANTTSYTYVNSTGVYLKTSEGRIPVYNTLFPDVGVPVLSATANVDWKIGKNSTDYIRSMSGVYHFGVVYEATTKFGAVSVALIPVLVVDSKDPDVYDTIIADMSYGWYSFTFGIANALPQTNYLIPRQLTFDFTDEKPFKLGDGNESLTYDYNKDGIPDYSAGTVGARVLDIWRITDNSTQVVMAGERPKVVGVIAAKLLEPMDPHGNYFGLMYDPDGHGTSTAATVASRGHAQYNIYKNSTSYPLAGMAPGAKIIPIKSLWVGDALYSWLWASGFDLGKDGKWAYTGEHKADIISNSWGISDFPVTKYGPGFDLLSVLSSLLMVPHALAKDYPGTLFVNAVGNDGVGYGSVGAPNTSPLAISVGATTNNVHLQYGPFANITRFGSSVASYDDVADFSSRGPGLLGDPKPELMAIGSYGFTPTDVTVKNLGSKEGDPNNGGAFAFFGGTSMAAPMVAGAAALVMQEEIMKTGKVPDPFAIKSILMSSAKDLKNDPFVQGSGRVDALAAVELARGDTGSFSVYTNDTAKTIIDSLRPSILTFSRLLGIINSGYTDHAAGKVPPTGPARETRWFAGSISPGKQASTDIVIENPTKKEQSVELSSTVEKLVGRYEVTNATKLFQVDPTHNNVTFGFEPNYYNLTKMAGGDLPDSDLMVARVNFPFSSFMNQTQMFADSLRIASVYVYNWQDINKDDKVSYKEIELINRGGAYGTTQEARIGDPKEKFTGTPVVGVYPVPSLLSFWRGDTLVNSTSMNYTLTVELYKRMPSPEVRFDKSGPIAIPPDGKATVHATIYTQNDTLSGVYYHEILAKGSQGHTVVMPVSYIVTTKPVQKDVPVIVSPPAHIRKDEQEIEGSLGLKPNGYVGGLSDMVSRYSTGDWRSYYFSVTDPTVTTMTLKVSWPHNSTSIDAFVYGPNGRVVASSVPAGQFEEFAGWPSNDWLGPSPVSEGGAFFFSQNDGENSTVLQVPINGTGTYSLLLHNTLFQGESLYEPLSVQAKFSTLLADTTPPLLTAKVPKFVTGGVTMIPITINDTNPSGGLSISVDGKPEASNGNQVKIEGETLADGQHLLTVESKDTVGNSASNSWQFTVDRTPPTTELFVRSNNDNSTIAVAPGKQIIVSKQATLAWNVSDTNGVEGKVAVRLPNATPSSFDPHSSIVFDSTSIADGHYNLTISSKDVPGNNATAIWGLIVDNTAPKVSLGVSQGDVNGTAKITLQAQDENLKSAMLYVGDRILANVTGLGEYGLDTTSLPDGKYDVKLVALDMAGNQGIATTVLTVANTKPVVVDPITILGAVGGLAVGSAIAWTVSSKRRL
jgi:hypothetical protein